MGSRVAAALEAARHDAARPAEPPPDGLQRFRRFAVGDPQAPLERFFEVLDGHGLLAESGRLVSDALLVSIGDHFDYGPPGVRDAATRGGLELLSWLAAHPPDQVVILLGNHDLARVCELAPLDAEAFVSARELADRAYRGDPSLEAEFLARFPFLPSAEILSRDFSCFAPGQRALAERLLRSGRARLAWAAERDLLCVHAGVTRDDLALIGAAGDAYAVASALNAFLDERLARWEGGPLNLEPLHQAGDARRGEGRGILYHRPCKPELAKPGQLDGPPRRRFDPRTLPREFSQVVGHIRDGKCRELLGDWADAEPSRDGPVRSLVTDGRTVRYGFGATEGAAMYFIDNGMAHVDPRRYELFDLNARAGTGR